MPTQFIKQFTDAALDLVYPPSCGLCHCSLEQQALQHRLLCDDCFQKLDLTEDRGCPSCGAKLGPFAPLTPKCVHCRNDRFAFREVVSLGNYQGELKAVCLQCKEVHGHHLVQQFCDLFFDRHQDLLENWDIDCLACVPQHWRKRFRGAYNTSAELAERMSRRLQKPFLRQLLVKKQHTSDQAGLLPSHRRKNVKNAFGITSDRLIQGRRILLIDDVLTTGSTADACSRVLKKAGADEIFVAVLARGLG